MERQSDSPKGKLYIKYTALGSTRLKSCEASLYNYT
nr:MAG TPA: hypothetical protein [Caudoviricetes sp.]DAX89672.1 MAG TPA: hypothetical protein [Caudoviricetes sp.]